MKNTKCILLVLAQLCSTVAFAQVELPPLPASIANMSGCDLDLTTKISTSEFFALAESNPAIKIGLSAYRESFSTHLDFVKNIDFDYFKAIFADPEMVYFQQRLTAYFNSLSSVPASETELVRHFATLLTNEVPANSISSRIRDFLHPKIGQDKYVLLKRFLGENTIEEAATLAHGGDPFHPTPESLLGQYLAETHAQTVVRKFRTTEDVTSAFNSEDRMVIAVSPATLPIYLKYFSKYNFFGQYHTPRQGTLHTFFTGKYGSYGNMNSPLNISSPGSLMPHVLLTTTEGQRLKQYIEAASAGASNEPWTRTGYCPTSGYGSCTHWVANIPLGDEIVKELKFPGKVDRYADNNVSVDPQIGPTSDEWMQNVTFDGQNYRVGNRILYDSKTLTLVRRVWKNPSQMQFAEVLGPEEIAANTRGEYASPGFVALRLTGHVQQKRMPFIFYVVPDVTTPINPEFDPQINAF